MLDFQKFHLPYREETAFSLLAFCVFLVPLIFSIFSYENFESVKFATFLIFTGLALLFYLKNLATDSIHNVITKKIGALGGFALVWILISALLSEDKIYAIFGFYYRFTSGLLFYLALLCFGVLLFRLINREKLLFLLKILAFDALVIAVITYLQGFGWIFYAGLEFGGFYRGPSLLGNPNYSAMFLASVLPLVIYFFTQAKFFKTQLYYSISSFIILFGIIMLASRGSLLALVGSSLIALIFLFYSSMAKKTFLKIFVGVFVLGLLGFIFLSVSRPDALSAVVKGNDANTTSRFYAWKISLQGIARQPWFGSGPGNYALFFEQNRNTELPGNIGVFDDAHNLFLHLAVTGGLPWLLVFIVLISWSFIQGLILYIKSKDLLFVALAVSLIAWVISAGFNPVPIPQYIVLLIILIGLILPGTSTAEIKLTTAQKGGAVILGGFLFYCGLALLVSEHMLGIARNSYNYEDYQKVYRISRLAYALNPTNGLFLIYNTFSAINLQKSQAEIEMNIQSITKLHPTQSGTYVSAADLHYLNYIKTDNRASAVIAVENMEKAVEIDPLFAERFGQLALYFYELGNFELSRFYVEKALSIQDNIFSGWILLAKLNQLAGQREAVVFNLEQAFKLNPNIPQLKYLLNLAKNTTDIKMIPLDVMRRNPELK